MIPYWYQWSQIIDITSWYHLSIAVRYDSDCQLYILILDVSIASKWNIVIFRFDFISISVIIIYCLLPLSSSCSFELFLQKSHSKDMKWVPQHMDICEEIGVTWPPPMPSHLKDNAWLAVVQKREQEIISIAQIMNPNILWVDTSQTVARARPSTHEEVPTVVPGSHLWNYEASRYIVGREFMRVQGYPFESLPGAATLSDSQCADLAGNSFSTSAICAIDIAILMSLECMPENDSTENAIREAMASLNASANDVAEFSIDWLDQWANGLPFFFRFDLSWAWQSAIGDPRWLLRSLGCLYHINQSLFFVGWMAEWMTILFWWTDLFGSSRLSLISID